MHGKSFSSLMRVHQTGDNLLLSSWLCWQWDFLGVSTYGIQHGGDVGLTPGYRCWPATAAFALTCHCCPCSGLPLLPLLWPAPVALTLAATVAPTLAYYYCLCSGLLLLPLLWPTNVALALAYHFWPCSGCAQYPCLVLEMFHNTLNVIICWSMTCY